MENKINIAELLKNCPKGMELYSPLCGKCKFDSLNWGTIICKKGNTQEITFTSEGYYMLPVFDDCECVLFPSKENRDWSKFVPPCKFKDGDVVVVGDDKAVQMFIVEEQISARLAKCYTGYDFDDNIIFDKGNWRFSRLTTEEEKQKLFDALKDNDYKWDEETKTLEKLIKPKFKVGDIIKYKNGKEKNGVEYGKILSITDNKYDVAVTNDMGIFVPIADQDDWELVPNKFDISTLKPFDKVLVRDLTCNPWRCAFYSHYVKDDMYPYRVCTNIEYKQCIPYEGNEHLLGTTDECDEYYKNWV